MRNGLEELCTACRLRLPRGVARCPFCRGAVGASDTPPRRPDWALVLPARGVRWLVLVVGGVLMLPLPLVVFAVPLIAVPFSSGEVDVGELALNVFVAAPGLFLAGAIVAPMAVIALAVPVGLVLSLAELFRGRRVVEVSVRDRPLEMGRNALAGRLGELERRLAGIRERFANGKAFSILAGLAATVLVGLSFVAREEHFLPWTAALVGVFSVGVLYLAGALWLASLLPAIGWLTSGAGLTPRPVDRGRRAFDPDREAAELLERCSAGRARHTGAADGSSRVVAPLSGEQVLAFRLRGRVGDWRVDDAVVAGSFTLHGADGEDSVVRSQQWAVPLEVPTPRRVAMTDELRDLLHTLGIPPSEDALLAEAVVRPGERVTARGDEDEVLATGQGYRDEWTAVLTGTRERPVVLTRAT